MSQAKLDQKIIILCGKSKNSFFHIGKDMFIVSENLEMGRDMTFYYISVLPPVLAWHGKFI